MSENPILGRLKRATVLQIKSHFRNIQYIGRSIFEGNDRIKLLYRIDSSEYSKSANYAICRDINLRVDRDIIKPQKHVDRWIEWSNVIRVWKGYFHAWYFDESHQPSWKYELALNDRDRDGDSMSSA